MPDNVSTYIYPGGDDPRLSVGSTGGNGHSLNILRNFRSGSGVNVNTSVDYLRTFYRDYTQNSSANNRPISFSQFRGGLVYRVDIIQFSESTSNQYHNINDGILRLRVTGGSEGTFTLAGMTVSQTIGSGGIASWTNLEGSWSPGAPTKGDYSLTIIDNGTGVPIPISMTSVRCYEGGYGISNIVYQGNTYNRFNPEFYNKN
jgi:hypothetical protein